MDKELLTKLRHEREVYRRWKLGQVNCEEYRSMVWTCRDAVRKAKTRKELNLARNVKGKRKAFSKFIDNKRKTRKNMSLLMNEMGNLNTEEAKVLNALFMSVFTEIK